MIMQGKITKVVNMKPKELLHMIEETVGATLYQAKREKAENELRVKEQTVASVENVSESTSSCILYTLFLLVRSVM